MDYYQVLGVPKNCDRNALHKAFRALSKKYHPDRFDEATRPRAEKSYQKIVVAFNTLKDVRLRAKYDQSMRFPSQETAREDPRQTALKYHKSGVAAYNQTDYQAALEHFKRALYYHEDAETYYFKALAESKMPKLRKESVASMQKAVSLQPKNSAYYWQLAKLFLDYGLKIRARTVLEKAVERFPQNRELLALFHEVEPEKAKKSGLLSGLFGKKEG